MSQTPATIPVEELCDKSVLARPLCVDLDGTLVRTDTLWESVLVLVRLRPWLALLLPFWLVRGRAGFKRKVAERVSLDVTALPYRSELTDVLRISAEKGRRLVLSTAADERVAQAVAQHLAFFHEVLASDGTSNNKAHHKGEALKARFGATGFDYVGDSDADLPVLEAAQRGYLVAASSSTASRARALGDKVQVVSRRGSRLRAMVKALRIHQWSKNALVVVPVLLAPGLPSLRQLGQAALAMLCMSLCASAGYVFNDIMDVSADRAHRTKHTRPFASGDLPLVWGPPLLLALFATSFGLAVALLPLGFVAMLAGYFIISLTYSFYLKMKLLVDVIVLAWLYTHRVVAGGVATSVPISHWLLAFSMFFFTSLAFAKRYIELRATMGKDGRLHSRGYFAGDLEMVASMGPTAGYLAVLVFCLYIESNSIIYANKALLWGVAPVLLYWISRVWFLAHRGQLQDDPVKFAITDRLSWACALVIGLVAAAARFWP